MKTNYLKFSLFLITCLCLDFQELKPQCSATSITPDATSTCYNFSDYTTYSGSSPCAGAGFGGSGDVKVIPICTNSSAQCIVISASGLPGNGGVSFALYSGCTGNPPTLSGYVTNSGACYSNATNAVWTSQRASLSPNTCYYLAVWSKNGFPTGSQFCTYVTNPTYDYCTTAAPLGTSPQNFNNYCYTIGSDGSYTEPPPSQFCASSLQNNAWYTFTVNCSCTPPCQVTGTVGNIVCYGGGAGFQLGFWSGSCSSLSYLGCTSGSGGTVTFTLNNASPCQVVRLGMDGNSGANCSYSIAMTNVVPLPIELINIGGKAEEKSNRLFWSTATEKDNAYFTIEKSPDGINFNVLSKVNGAGTSYTRIDYEYVDDHPYEGITYYQLSQTDYDGTTKKLGIIAVDNKSKVKDIEFVPNPVSENGILKIPTYKEEDISISIEDITGKIIESKNITIEPGTNAFEVNFSSLEKGMYFIHISSRTKNQYIKVAKE
jgi:hypothetical protein